MKTLKQIREEYDDKFLSQVDYLPEDLMLENKGIVHAVPSNREMPSLLVFRRVTYRLYPNKQVVALYYSKLVDKYLSIPFGPGGNLNLSEAIVLDKSELDEGIVGDTVEKGRKWLANTKGFKVAQEIGHNLPGYGDAKAAKDHFAKGEYKNAAKSTLHSVGKALATGAAVAGTVYGLRGGLRALSKVKGILPKVGSDNSDNNDSSTNKDVETTTHHGELLRPEPTAKISSSWDKAPHENPVFQSKFKQAALRENKITDIRKMVKEDVDTKDLIINGRTITLNTSMAKRILEVYDSVNTRNKKLVEGMLNDDLESFKKLLNFSIKA